MSRSLSRWQAVLLGLVMIGLLAAAVFGLSVVGGRYAPWHDTFTVRVGFKQNRGVEVGTRVRVQGVDAGEVIALEPPATPGGNVILTLQLDNRKLRTRGLVRADATAQIVTEGMVGGKVVEIDPGTSAAAAVGSGAEIEGKPTVELADAMMQAGKLLEELEKQKGKVGEVVDNTNKLLTKGHEAISSIQRISEAVESAPVLGGYVKDPQALLHPPGTERKEWLFNEVDLFEPNTDRLTEGGKKLLDPVVQQIAGLTRHEGSSVVIVSWSQRAPGDGATVRRLTQNQSEAVVKYIQDQGGVYKKYWIWSRKTTPLGLGTERPPLPNKDKLPAAGLGVFVFVPQG